MDSASQSSVCVARQLSVAGDSGTNFDAHTFKQAEDAPTFGRDERYRGYHGAYHPPATGDGHRP